MGFRPANGHNQADSSTQRIEPGTFQNFLLIGELQFGPLPLGHLLWFRCSIIWRGQKWRVRLRSPSFRKLDS